MVRVTEGKSGECEEKILPVGGKSEENGRFEEVS